MELMTRSLVVQAVLLASIKQGKRVLQRLDGPNVPPPGAYTTSRWLLKVLPLCAWQLNAS